MKSQFILLYLVLILFISLNFLYYNFSNNYYYQPDLGQYVAEDFYTKLLLYPDYFSLINNTYYSICLNESMLCYNNGTNIIIITTNSEYILLNP
ncbi:MAG: hypothetical protein ACP5G1_00580 [Nanopusillaceae archaeon]